MDIEQKAEMLTTAYIHSYNLALKEVKNPDFANQIAMNVILAISATEPKHQDSVNPLKMLFQHITENAQEQEEENNE